MASIYRDCDIYQGYNFKKDVQSTVGYLISIKVGDVTLTADQTCKDPEDPTSDLKVACVLSSANWGTGPTDCLYFAGQLSIANKQEVSLMVLNDLTKVEVICQFQVHDYDLIAKKYFKCMHSDGTDLKGLVEKSGSQLTLQVSDDPSSLVESPANFDFMIGIKPQPEEQSIHMATSSDAKIVKKWGITVS